MKRILSVALVLCFALTAVLGMSMTAFANDGLIVTPQNPEASHLTCPKGVNCPLDSFTDTINDEWYHDGIHYCVDEGLMIGTSATTFEPETDASRAMIVSILYRMQNEPAFMNANMFSDVPAGIWYEKAVVWASGKNIVSGYGNGIFDPEKPITREELVSILFRYVQFMEIDVSESENCNILSYDDAFDVSGYACRAFQWACFEGIVAGDNGRLKPTDHASRAEVAAMIQRFSEKYYFDPTPLAGGWTINGEFEDAQIPEDALAAFDKAFEGFTGVGYTPVAYLGSQVVAGRNYAFLCKTATVTAKPVEGLSVVRVYADLSGGAQIMNIAPVSIPDVIGTEVDYPASGMVGGWNLTQAAGAALPEAAQKAFETATGALLGVNYKPLALLGSQVVAGQNFAVLCTASTVTAEPSTAMVVMVLYAGLDGSAEVTSVSGFDF